MRRIALSKQLGSVRAVFIWSYTCGRLQVAAAPLKSAQSRSGFPHIEMHDAAFTFVSRMQDQAVRYSVTYVGVPLIK